MRGYHMMREKRAERPREEGRSALFAFCRRTPVRRLFLLSFLRAARSYAAMRDDFSVTAPWDRSTQPYLVRCLYRYLGARRVIYRRAGARQENLGRKGCSSRMALPPVSTIILTATVENSLATTMSGFVSLLPPVTQ